MKHKLLIVKKTRAKITETSQKRWKLLPYPTKCLSLSVRSQQPSIPESIFQWGAIFLFVLYEVHFSPLTLTLDNLADPDVWRV